MDKPNLYVYRAKVTNVVDGDTFDAEVDLGFHVVVRVRFRLLDVDTPEIFRPSSAEEKARGFEAKKFVESTCLGKTVLIESKKTGKYGRWLANVILEDGSTLGELLVERDLVKRKE